MYVTQSTQIKTGSIEAKYLKNNMSLIDTTQVIQDSQFVISSFNDLLNVSTPLVVNQKVNKIQFLSLKIKFKKIYYEIKKKIIQMAMALTGYNGDNETSIQMSRSLDYSIYDENFNEIPVFNTAKPIDMWISRDTSVALDPFQQINALNASMINASSNSDLGGSQLINGFIVNGFNMSGSNQSIHIQLKPANQAASYLTLLKFGNNPLLQKNNYYFDWLEIFCPNDLRTEANYSFYLIFLNMSRVNAFKGYVGFSLVEIDSPYLDCSNKSANSIDWLIDLVQKRTSQNETTFTDNFELRTYASGCYFMNTTSNSWSSYGIEILSDSNITHTHCQSRHLTTFAGGLIVLPNAINFNYVWSHASFLQNPVIYSTVIALVCMYLLLGIWSRRMDSKDSKKEGVTILGDEDNKSVNKYIYEIIVFTGARLNAGTCSKVKNQY